MRRYTSASRRTACDAQAGQSVTELALVIPVILLLLLTVADFGRFFSTAVTIESAARTAAEIASQEYVAELANAASGVTINYTLIDQRAWSTVCNETRGLPNMTPASGGGQCDGVPTMVCVHDGADSACGSTFNHSGAIPAQCSSFATTPTNALDGTAQGHSYVEVRLCYRFSTFFQVVLPFFSGSLSPLSGDFFVDRTRFFTIANY